MAIAERAFGVAPDRPFARFARMELFKLRRRPMTFILLAILWAVSLGIPLLFYMTLKLAGNGSGGIDAADRQVLIDRILLPGVLSGAVETALSFGIPLLIILTAASFGGEFAWGTVRLLFARGEGRGEYVASKAGAIAVWWLVGLVGATALGIAAGALLGLLEDPAVPLAIGGGDAAALAGRTLAAWLGALVYVAITASITVNLRSTAYGLAIGLMAFYGERIMTGVLASIDIALVRWLTKLGANYNLRVVIGGDGVDNPVWFAWGMLLIYAALALTGAVRVLRARDIHGPQGG